MYGILHGPVCHESCILPSLAITTAKVRRATGADLEASVLPALPILLLCLAVLHSTVSTDLLGYMVLFWLLVLAGRTPIDLPTLEETRLRK